MKIQLTQNPNRYKKVEGGFTISSLPTKPTPKQLLEIKPLILKEEVTSEVVTLKPLLSDNVKGIIVQLISTGDYLCSKVLYETLTINEKINPHYSYKVTGMVLKTKMGKSIPIVKIDDTKLEELSLIQLNKAKKAGVKSIKWGYEEERGGVIEQIDWTLGASLKPLDEFVTYDLNLKDSNSLEGYKIIPLDGDKKIDETLLKSNLTAISKRLALIQADTNTIKELYYNGKASEGSTTPHKILTSTTSIDDERNEPVKQVIIKTTFLQSVNDTIGNQAIDKAKEDSDVVAKAVEENSKTLQQKIDEQAVALDVAQRGDRDAQAQLNQQLESQRDSINSTRDFADEIAKKYQQK